MSAALLGVLAGWVVLRLLGATRPWPSRLIELDRGAGHVGRPPRVAGTAGGGASRDSVATVVPRRVGRRPGGGSSSARARVAGPAEIAAAVDLLGVAVSAGHSLRGAVAIVGASGTGTVAEAFGVVTRRVADGGALQAEFSGLVDLLGEPARPLASTLAASLSSGSPIAPQLQRLADAERARERRQREERVRRLPVLLLAPLVGLILPAFVLIGVVPVALTSIQPLATGPSSAPAVSGIGVDQTPHSTDGAPRGHR